MNNRVMQNHVQFVGLPNEDPNAHIGNFLEVCDTFKIKKVSEDAVRLYLFLFSLKGKATWDSLAEKFLGSYTWEGQRAKPKTAGVHNVDAISAMEARLASVIEQKIGNLAGTSTSKSNQTLMFCDFCNEGHSNQDCPSMGGQVEQVEFVQGNRQNNPCSNTYNLGWRNHPNFSWGGQGQQRQNQPPSFQNRGPSLHLPYEAEECSALVIKKETLQQKLEDIGSFSFPCSIGSIQVDRALADLSTSINVISSSIYELLGLVTPKPVRMSINLAYISFRYPKGVIEDVLVKVKDFVFPIDFVVLDMKKDVDFPIILGLGWVPLLRISSDYYPDFVQISYANMTHKTDKDLQTIISTIKGVRIILDRECLAPFLGIPNTGNSVTMDSNRKTINEDPGWNFDMACSCFEIRPQSFCFLSCQFCRRTKIINRTTTENYPNRPGTSFSQPVEDDDKADQSYNPSDEEEDEASAPNTIPMDAFQIEMQTAFEQVRINQEI
ncbi:hypothetical protein M9H77_07269 [Catharanthus roseus]|uniref:Uncharacterized protein n=1 Tax=Catharanthus roseus TaxID=4058 RepID=A0ACC0BUP4_CATRO|nr:hypothetical protein M9H77_07269 [Catharanthus roseus]